MRTSKWMFTAALLVSLSAGAQQVVVSQQPAPASSTQITPGPERSVAEAAVVAQAAAAPQATQETSSQATQPASPQATAPAPTPSTQPQPVTMDQVVDRFIEREHSLMKALAARTPVVGSAWLTSTGWGAVVSASAGP